jgi:four helix bundle protein
MSDIPRLDHENLDVYQCAIDFLAMASRLGAALPRGEGDLRDQLKRAAVSIPLNIAESCGKMSTPDRSRFLLIARGSALECGAVLDVAVALGILDTTSIPAAKSLLTRIVAMLTKMSRVT